MATDLTGNTIESTFGQLLHVDEGATGSAKTVYDGDGTATALKVSTADVQVSGNFTVSGTSTTIDTTNLNVDDGMIQLGKDNNAADVIDIGFVGLYDTSGSQDLYAGLFRDATDGVWKLFKDSQEDLSTATVVNTGATGYTAAPLTVGTFTSTGIDDNATSTAITIGSSQNVLINTTQEFQSLNGRGNLVVGSGSANEGMTIYSGSAGSIMFADGTSGTDPYTGQINYEHSDNSMRFGTNGGTERLRIDNSGNVEVKTGNLVIGTSGKGIDFSEKTPDGSGTTGSEVLDDYEEGTWTPVLSDGTNDATTNANGWTHGTYVKIGKLIYLQCTMNTSSLGSVSGGVRITGLPFDIGATIISPVYIYGSQLNISAGQSLAGRFQNGTDYIHLSLWDGAAGVTNLQGSEWSANGYANISGFYYE